MKKKIVIDTSQELLLDDAFQRFMQHRKAMNISDATVRYYEKCFEYFCDFFGRNRTCAEVMEDVTILYILHLRNTNPNIADSTVNNYLRGIRAILYFCMEKEYIRPFKIAMIKAEKKVKETYTDDELERLLKKPDIKKCGFTEYRNWVMVCYLLGTGNRSSTLRDVRIGDIDISSHEIRLRRVKNKRQYFIPLSQTLEKVLVEYIQYRKGKPDDYLFCNQYGEQITTDGLTSIISKYNLARGVNKTSVHLFRHTFAKKWILNRGDMFRLQKILGHSSLDIVKEYVNMFGSDLQLDFESFNPLDNMGVMRERTRIQV